MSGSAPARNPRRHVDAVVIGAGFAGLYMCCTGCANWD